MRKHVFQKRSGEGTPLTIAIVLALLMLFCAVSEYARLWIIAQGVREAAQSAIISVVNDNYDDVYHAVREGYAAGWFPGGDGWEESQDLGDVYGHMANTLGLTAENGDYVKYAGGQEEFRLSDLSVSVQNNHIASGKKSGYTAVGTIQVDIPIRFLNGVFPPLHLTLHVKATYIPKF